MIAALAALLTVARVYFSFIPNVQPNTVVFILVAMALGPHYGVVLAILSTFVSNMILGSGPWTLFQMITWSIIALISGGLKGLHKKIPFYIMALYVGVTGLFYGFVMSLLSAPMYGNFWGYYLAGLPFDISHAVGNIVFYLVLYKPIFAVLDRYLKK